MKHILESFEQFKMFFIFLIAFALSCMVVGFIITWWSSQKNRKAK